MSRLVKLCGITTATDAQTAMTAGADWLGLIFVPDTPRTVSPAQLQPLMEATRMKARLIGVFRNQPPELINELARLLPLHAVQLHGDESPDACRQIERPVIKVFSLQAPPPLEHLQAYAPVVTHALLDWPKGVPGPVDFSAITHYRTALPTTPLLLAGHLTPETVGSVIAQWRPDGVDVASGVESAAGVKDADKMQAFVHAARTAFAQLNPEE